MAATPRQVVGLELGKVVGRVLCREGLVVVLPPMLLQALTNHYSCNGIVLKSILIRFVNNNQDLDGAVSYGYILG